MDFSHRVVSGVDVIDLEGSVDSYSVNEVKKFYKTLLKAGSTKILFSLDKVTFLDSSGLGFLTNVFFESKTKGFTFKISDLSEEAKRAIGLTRMGEDFEIFDTDEAGIEALNNTAR